jgi:hypothetical protein
MKPELIKCGCKILFFTTKENKNEIAKGVVANKKNVETQVQGKMSLLVPGLY